MGLLDLSFDNLDDPKKQMLLAMAAGLLTPQRNRGLGGFGAALGQAVPMGLNQYAQASMMKQKMGAAEQEKQLRALQIAEARRGADYQTGAADLAKRFAINGPGVPYNDAVGDQPPQGQIPGQQIGFDTPGYVRALPQLGPQGIKDSLAAQQMMAKESHFGKVDFKDATPESIREFQQKLTLTGIPDYSLLVPVRKMEVVDGKVVNPYTVKPGEDVVGSQSKVIKDANGNWTYNPAFISPVDKARLGLDYGRYGMEAGRYGWETGMKAPGVGGLPTLSGPPQASGGRGPGMPATQPAAAPSVENPVIPPKEQAAGWATLLPHAAKSYETVQNYPVSIQGIREAKTLLEDPSVRDNLYVGTASQKRLAVVKFLRTAMPSVFGDLDEKAVAASGELNTRLFQPILDNLKKMDAQPSQQQQEMMRQAFGSSDDDPKALVRMLSVMEDSFVGKINTHNSFVDKIKLDAAKAYRVDIPEAQKPKEQAAPDTPPVKGARKAPDGKWYIKSGDKYYRVGE